MHQRGSDYFGGIAVLKLRHGSGTHSVVIRSLCAVGVAKHPSNDSGQRQAEGNIEFPFE